MKNDAYWMEKCVALAGTAMQHGELPFGSVLVRDGTLVSQSENKARGAADVTAHAEIMVLRQAQKRLKQKELSRCTLYTMVEPCPMCAFVIRELRIKKVVFSLRSPIMGGYSKWRILQDKQLGEHAPCVYGDPPGIVSGLLGSEAEAVWNAYRNSAKKKTSRCVFPFRK